MNRRDFMKMVGVAIVAPSLPKPSPVSPWTVHYHTITLNSGQWRDVDEAVLKAAAPRIKLWIGAFSENDEIAEARYKAFLRDTLV